MDAFRQVLEKIDALGSGLDARFRSLEGRVTDVDERTERLERAVPSRVKVPGSDAAHWRGYSGRKAVGAWLADVYGRKILGKANQVGDVDPDGGYLVPDMIRPEVVRVIEQVGTLRKLPGLRIIPMASDTQMIPTKATGPTVTWEGQGVAPTATKGTFARPSLTAKKLIALDEISSELVEDSAVDILDYIAQLFAEAVAREEDRVAFKGNTGSGDPFDGLLTVAGITEVVMGTGNTTFDKIGYNDLVDLMHAVDDNVVENGVFVFHVDILGYLRKLKDTTGNPIWAPMAAAQPATILGRPYYLANQMPGGVGAASQNFVLYGDYRYYALGDRRRMSVSISQEVGFQADTTWMKVTERIALKELIPSAFARLKTSAV